MATGSLHVNRDIILATRKQMFKERKQVTPHEAVLAMAQMQRRPRPLLTYATDHHDIALIAQVTRTEVYDPVMSALLCRKNGADVIAFFTDHSIYDNDYDDALLVARAIDHTPLLYQNYTFDEYGVMLARGADASGILLYSSVLAKGELLATVSMAQRWKMSVQIQVNSEEALDFALSLSPHVLSFGERDEGNVELAVGLLNSVRDKLPDHVRVMLSHTLYSPEEVEIALGAKVDALIVDEHVMREDKSAFIVRQLVDEAMAQRNPEGGHNNPPMIG